MQFFNHFKSIILYAQLPHFWSFTTISIFLSLQSIFISSLDSIFSPKRSKFLQWASKNLTALEPATSIPSLFSSLKMQKLHFSLPKDRQQQFWSLSFEGDGRKRIWDLTLTRQNIVRFYRIDPDLNEKCVMQRWSVDDGYLIVFILTSSFAN